MVSHCSSQSYGISRHQTRMHAWHSPSRQSRAVHTTGAEAFPPVLRLCWMRHDGCASCISRRAWMKMMLPGSRTPAAVASLCLALTCAFVGLAHGQQSTYLAPVFLWSPASDYVTVADPGVTSRVSYEVPSPCPRTWKPVLVPTFAYESPVIAVFINRVECLKAFNRVLCRRQRPGMLLRDS